MLIMVIDMTIQKHFTIKQVAEALQLSERTIRRWIKSGRLRAVEFPGRFGIEYRIPASGLKALGFQVNDEGADGNTTETQP